MNRRARVDGSISDFRRVDADTMGYLVTVAWEFKTDELHFHHGGTVRNRSGERVRTVGSPEPVDLDAQLVEIDPVVKMYLTSSDRGTATVTSDGVELSFGAPSRITLDARSYATGPTGTVSTTADPEWPAWTVSHFGAGMESTDPERSFPTLRGHPQSVELGGDRTASPALEMASSSVTVAAEPRIDSVLRTAPLAYYRGAQLTLSDEPGVAATGTSVSLNGDGEPTPCELL